MTEVLTAARVFTGSEVMTEASVVISQNEIRWVGAAAELPDEYAAAPQTGYPGSTVMPGLIDCHVHLGFDGGPDPAGRMRSETDEQQVVLMLRSARELLGVGVTTARDLGGRGYLSVLVRDSIAAGMARGPRLVVAGCPVTVTGGHCWFMGGEADSEDELRRLVRSHRKHGTDLIKVMSTGGFMTKGSAPWYAQFTTAQLAIIVEEARRVDMPVAAHAHGIEGIQRAVDAGVTTIEHCSFVTETNERCFSEVIASQIAERGIFVCATINANAPYIAELTGLAVGQHVKPLHDLGVRLIAGTDAGIDSTPHHQYVGGLEYLVRLGLPPQDVLTRATARAAEALGVDAVTGRLAPGFEADVIVVDGDPLADIAALAKLRRVIARGRDYLPDSGRFDVSAPGTPFATQDREVSMRLIAAARKRRNA
jgi:imidazolonepropionase-like amidohydrolase